MIKDQHTVETEELVAICKEGSKQSRSRLPGDCYLRVEVLSISYFPT